MRNALCVDVSYAGRRIDLGSSVQRASSKDWVQKRQAVGTCSTLKKTLSNFVHGDDRFSIDKKEDPR